MCMVLVFDLDDTLYDERRYVESGLRAVAAFGEQRFGWPAAASFRFMRGVLDREGRGAVFDRWLQAHGVISKALVRTCIGVYRGHTPRLRLFAPAARLLPKLARRMPLYLVSDGNLHVQRRKAEALGLAPFFRKLYFTHQYGVTHAKPSPYCFALIRQRESCHWADMVYVGDNPAKDFVALNRLGGHTVRVLTGLHRQAKARRGYEAQHVIAGLAALPPLLDRLKTPG